MTKSLSKYLSMIILFLFCSCSTGIKQVGRGFWAIDFIEYSQNKDILYECGTNIIIFKDEKCTMPIYFEDRHNASKRYGNWEIIQERGQYFLKINTDNEIFGGIHKVCFKKDYEKKIIKMTLSSDYLYMECSKGLFNFDRDNEIIDDYLCK